MQRRGTGMIEDDGRNSCCTYLPGLDFIRASLPAMLEPVYKFRDGSKLGDGARAGCVHALAQSVLHHDHLLLEIPFDGESRVAGLGERIVQPASLSHPLVVPVLKILECWICAGAWKRCRYLTAGHCRSTAIILLLALEWPNFFQ